MENKKYNVILIITIVISVIARIMSWGWFLMIFMVIVPIYFIFFYLANQKAIKYINKYKIARSVFYTSCITLAAACICMPDFIDVGPGRAVFGLVRDDSILDFLYVMGEFLLLTNIITIIIGFRIPKIVKKNDNITNNSENNTDKDINN